MRLITRPGAFMSALHQCCWQSSNEAFRLLRQLDFFPMLRWNFALLSSSSVSLCVSSPLPLCCFAWQIERPCADAVSLQRGSLSCTEQREKGINNRERWPQLFLFSFCLPILHPATLKSYKTSYTLISSSIYTNNSLPWRFLRRQEITIFQIFLHFFTLRDTHLDTWGSHSDRLHKDIYTFVPCRYLYKHDRLLDRWTDYIFAV